MQQEPWADAECLPDSGSEEQNLTVGAGSRSLIFEIVPGN